MPRVEYAYANVDDLFGEYLARDGLNFEDAPAAVRMTISHFMAAMNPYIELLSDLPSDRRAFDYIAAAVEAYMVFFRGAVVVDDTP